MKIIEGSISEGTLRRPDLLRRLADELEILDPSKANLVSEARQNANILEMDGATNKDEEIAAFVLEDLHNELNRIATPRGFYFGGNECDPASIGFWKIYSDEI